MGRWVDRWVASAPRRTLPSLLLAGCCVSSGWFGGAARASAAEPRPLEVAQVERDAPVDFEGEILPMLRRSCLACHNKVHAAGELVLETPQAMLAGGVSGPAVVSNDPESSMVFLVATHESSPVMPPADNKVAAKNLTPQELGLLELWIRQGAAGEVRKDAGPKAWQPLAGAALPIYAAALDGDGRFVACGRGNQILLHEVPTGRFAGRLIDPAVTAAGRPAGQGAAAHLDLVQSLAFDPSGRLLASGGFREVKLWRRPDPVRSADVPVPGGVTTSLTVSDDGAMAAVGGQDGSILLWDPVAAKAMRTLTGHAAAVTGLRFAADAGRLYSASLDGSLRGWSTADGAALGRIDTSLPVTALTLAGAEHPVLVSAGTDFVLRQWAPPDRPARRSELAAPAVRGRLAPDRSRWAVATAAGQVLVVDAATGAVASTLAGHEGPVHAVHFSADGGLLATAGADRTVRLWDPAGGAAVAVLRGARAAVTAVGLLADPPQVVCGDVAGRLVSWRWHEQAPQPVPEPLESAPTAVAQSADGTLLALAAAVGGRPAVIVKRVDTGRTTATLLGHDGPITALAFSPDGARLVSGSVDRTARVWTLADAVQQAAFIGHAAEIRAVAFHPGNELVGSGDVAAAVRLWKAADGAEVRGLGGHAGAVVGLAFAAGGSRLVSASADKTVRSWNHADGGHTVIATPPQPLTALAASRDGNRVIFATADGTLTVAQADGRRLAALPLHSAGISALLVAADGGRMLSVGTDRLLGLWDLTEFELVEGMTVESGAAAAGFTNVPAEIVVAGGDASLLRRTLRFQRSYPRAAAAISGIACRGDVFYASALDGTVRGFNVQTGQATFQQNPGVPVRDLAVSPDGQVLAAGGDDCTVRLWHAAGNAAHAKPALTGFSAPVERVAFSADGGHVLAASGLAREVFSFTVAQGTPATPEQQFADLPAAAVGLAGIVEGQRPGVAAVAGKAIVTWGLAAGRQLAGHTAAVNVLQTLPHDRDRFASGGDDGMLRIWQVEGDGKPAKQVSCGGPISAVAFTPDAARVAMAGGEVAGRVFTVENGQRVAEVRGDHAALADISAADLRARAAVTTLAEQRRLSRERFTALSREAEAAKAANEGLPALVKTLGDALQAMAGPVDQHLQAERELAALRSQQAGLDEEVARCALRATQAREPLAAAEASRTAREEAMARAKALLDRVTAAAAAARAARAADPAHAAPAVAEDEARQALTTATQEHRQAQAARQAAEQAVHRAKARSDAAAGSTAQARKSAADAATRIVAAEAKVQATAGPVDASRATFDSARDAVATALTALRGQAESRRKQAERDKSVTDKAATDAQARAKAAEAATSAEVAALVKAAGDAKGRNDAAALAAAALCEAVANASAALDALAESQRTAAAAQENVRRAAADAEIARREARRAERPIRSLAISPDGLVIATCGDDLAIRLWQAEHGVPLESLPGGAMPAAVAFTSAGRLLVAGDTAASWDIQPAWTLERTIGDPESADLLVDRVAALAFGPDGKILATGGGEPSRSGELKLWNVADGGLVRTVANAHADVVSSVAFSADGQFLLSGAADRFARIFDVGTGRLVRSFEGHTHHVLGVAWRFDGRQIATCGADAAVKIWDPMTGEQMRTVSGAAKEVTAIAFLPGTATVVAAAGDRKARLIDATSGGVSRTFSAASAFLHAAAVSAGGKLVMAAGQDGVVHVWNTDNGQVVRTLGPPMADGGTGIPDARSP